MPTQSVAAPRRLAESVVPVSRAVDELARRLATLEEARRRRSGAGGGAEAPGDDDPTQTIPLPPPIETDTDGEEPTVVRELYAERARSTGRPLRPAGDRRLAVGRGGWLRQTAAAVLGMALGAGLTGGGLALVSRGLIPVDPSVRTSIEGSIDHLRPSVRAAVDQGLVVWEAGRQGAVSGGIRIEEGWHAALRAVGLVAGTTEDDGPVSGSGPSNAARPEAIPPEVAPTVHPPDRRIGSSDEGSADDGKTRETSRPHEPTSPAGRTVAPAVVADRMPSAAMDGDTLDQRNKIEADLYERIGIDPGLPRAERDDLVAAWYRRHAEAGDPHAQYVLALLYAQGRGVRQDFAVAAEWLRESALQGDLKAQYHLGLFYENGLGVPKDDIRALLWYHSSADKGDPRAQYNLGVFYAMGRGIPKDHVEARKWFVRADAAGLASAAHALGQMYEEGLGVAPDGARALEFYRRAAEGGNADAVERLAALSPETKVVVRERPEGPVARVASTEVVSAIQQMLAALDFSTGPVDGVLSDETRAAIAAYQRDAGLGPTGVPSQALLDHMIATVSAAGGDSAAAQTSVPHSTAGGKNR